jgi:hypothetical protein
VAPLASLAQEEGPAPQQRTVVRSLRLAAEQLKEAQTQALEAAPASEYWIGIGLGELVDIVKEQLGLEHGLLVDDVLPDSPALAAGFKKNDILVKVGDKALADPLDLVKAVEEAKETELSIGVLRGGKETTIKVTPAKRPKQELEARVIEFPKAVAPGQLQDEIKRLEDVLKALKEKGGAEGAGIVFARPGTILTPQRLEVLTKRPEFPKDLSITVTKEGDQPAKIHVKKGDKEWDVTEDKMGELPDDVRPHVHHFFGGLWGPGLKELAKRSLVGGPKVAPYYPHPVPPVAAPVPPLATSPVAPPAEASGSARAYAYRLQSRGSDEKLDEIMKELKALRKEVDELRGKSTEEKQ